MLGDFLNSALLAELLDTHCPYVAFHAAAYKHVGLLEAQPLAVLENNAVGTHRLLIELRASSVRRLVLISSDKAVQPRGIMGASKRLAELLVLGTLHEELIDADETLADTEYPALRRIVAPLPEPMEVNAWACRLANYVQQRDVAGAIELVHEVLTSYSPSDTILSIGAPAIEKARS